MADETYPMPSQGWTCFHCGDHFTTPGAAQDHFGNTPMADPACRIKVGEERGLVMALRRAEAELERYRADDSDMAREMHGMRAAHTVALRDAEQLGYDRGLADMRKHGWRLADEKLEA